MEIENGESDHSLNASRFRSPQGPEPVLRKEVNVGAEDSTPEAKGIGVGSRGMTPSRLGRGNVSNSRPLGKAGEAKGICGTRHRLGLDKG